jgi:nucleoside-triphosphatase THEP1
MKNDGNDRIVYSINVDDIQEVAQQVLERALTKKEVVMVGKSIGDYLDWFQAIENSIRKHITE